MLQTGESVFRGTEAARDQLVRFAKEQSYRAWATDTVRWSDTDKLGHVNHLAVGAYMETGRARFMAGIEVADQIFVTASLTINFLRELHWPDPVRIGTAVLKVGTTSFELVQGLFSGQLCIATSTATLVLIDGASRKPVPIPQLQREQFASFALQAS
ncbi:acyl-CoA thioesterase [Noviherbaspirillum pedocola]|uniref:Acyl-CoA thioesterase n=1 Tax=Noviherbaspirillum pedocola TaxID=2801341 RepID=A0A934WAC2_9BURK|nr:thioesterase family protein [Noviherbaspirillum pedocola]MBK4738504.1 acyl-CoA thioesterase [Noviherbaspirillum pedocola]